MIQTDFNMRTMAVSELVFASVSTWVFLRNHLYKMCWSYSFIFILIKLFSTWKVLYEEMAYRPSCRQQGEYEDYLKSHNTWYLNFRNMKLLRGLNRISVIISCFLFDFLFVVYSGLKYKIKYSKIKRDIAIFFKSLSMEKFKPSSNKKYHFAGTNFKSFWGLTRDGQICACDVEYGGLSCGTVNEGEARDTTGTLIWVGTTGGTWYGPWSGVWVGTNGGYWGSTWGGAWVAVWGHEL